jgi:DNA-binding response OmpR family regulator
MSRRILIIEPDASGRAMMDLVLTAEGHAVESVASAAEARPLLDQGPAIELAIADELGSRGVALEDVRWLRREYPSVPVLVLGALLSQRVMQELIRLRVVDALAKPFTPDELREAVTRALGRKAPRHDDALEYAAAIEAARRAIVQGRLDETAPALRRAQAIAPLDTEVMTLWALLAELEGRDDEADRGYRAALALRREEDTPAPDPHEGLARLGAYGDMRPASSLPPRWHGAPVWVVTEPSIELKAGSPGGPGLHVVVMSLGLSAEGPGALFFRAGTGQNAAVLLSGAIRPEVLDRIRIAGRLGGGPFVAAEPTRARLDLPLPAAPHAATGSRA